MRRNNGTDKFTELPITGNPYDVLEQGKNIVIDQFIDRSLNYALGKSIEIVVENSLAHPV